MGVFEKQLERAIKANVPTLVWGPPGVGKTDRISQVAKKLNLHFEAMSAANREPSDFAGLPVKRDNGVVFEPLAWALRLKAAGSGILFIDEVNTARIATQTALLKVVQDREVGDLHLGENVVTICAANPQDFAPSRWETDAALANRFYHLKVSANASEWIDWAFTQISVNPGLANIVAYINSRQSMLFQFPKNEQDMGGPWPSPRSWTNAAKLANGLTDISDISEVLSGIIGVAAASDYVAWFKARDLPNPEEVLSNCDTYTLPKKLDVIFAIMTEVVQYTVNRNDKKIFENAWTFVARIATDVAPDVAVPAMRALLQAGNKIGITPQKEIVTKVSPILKEIGN